MQTANTWALNAAELPLAFGQTREDPLIDMNLIAMMPRQPSVLMVASGGCNSAALAGSNEIADLHLVDINPAQLALARFKLWLLQNCTVLERLQILGHRHVEPTARQTVIEKFLQENGLASDVFGPLDMVYNLGPDYCGRFERLFAELAGELSDFHFDQNFLRTSDLRVQYRSVENFVYFPPRLRSSLERVMTQANLVALFGEAATSNRVMNFARHFELAIFKALKTIPNRSNPYLSQVLCGRFTSPTVFPWIGMPASEKPVDTQFTCGTMLEVMEKNPGAYDYISLSNILDWLTPEEAADTLAASFRALRQGGKVAIRQLNSKLDIRSCNRDLTWHNETAAHAHQTDRSFFYRDVVIGSRS